MLREQVRYKQRSQFCEKEREQTRHSIWGPKPVQVDCVVFFSQALIMMPELLRSRNQLQELIRSIVIKEEEVIPIPEKTYKKEPGLLWFTTYENKEKQVSKQSSRDYEDSVVLVYGRDRERIILVVNASLEETIFSNKAFTTIKLNGHELGNLTPDEFFSTLSIEFSARHSFLRILFLLEDFTPSQFSNFQGSGFVNSIRMPGRQIITLCWSSRYTEEDYRRFLSEFSRRVFVPSSNNDEETTAGDGMVRQKPYAKVNEGCSRKVNQNLLQRSIYEPIRPSAKATAKESETIVVENDGIPGNPATTSNSKSCVAGQVHDNKEVIYTDVQAVTKGSTGSKPITSEPIRMQEPTKGASGPLQNIFWSKKRPESVSMEQQDGGCGNRGKDIDERKEEGFCSRVMSCIIAAYACLLD